MRIIIENILTVTMNAKRDIGRFSLCMENGKIERVSNKLIDTKPGDYIIKGVAGEYYPCKPDIFHETYEWMGSWQ